MNWRDCLLNGLKRVDKDPKDDSYLSSQLKLLFSTMHQMDYETIKEIEQIDDLAVRAAVSFIKWYQGFDNVSYLRDDFRWLDQAIDRYLKKGSWSVVAVCFYNLMSITANEPITPRERVQSFQDYLRKRVNLLDHIDALKPDVQKRIIWNLQVALNWALHPHVSNSEKDFSEWGPIGDKIYKAPRKKREPFSTG